MLKQRLFASLVLVPLVLVAIYWTNFWVISALVFALIGLSAWEWLKLIPSEGKSKMGGMFLLGLLVSCVLSYPFFSLWLFVGLSAWVLIFLAVLAFPASQVVWGFRPVIAFWGLLLLPLFAQTVFKIYTLVHGQNLLLYVLCLVWAADVGAYVAGKFFGRHKLIPLVSPGKTQEGALGGLSLALLVAWIGYVCFVPVSGGFWFFLALMTALISMLGDLFISMLKRRCKLKDTGNLIPGHGGILDRLDSLIAAFPLFYCGIHFLPLGI
jgi:CDP-diglyceride synthetase